jgi:hypothetical protein
VFVGLGVLAVVAVFWMLPTGTWIVAAYKWIQGLGPWKFAAFVAIYTVLSMLFLPTSPLNVGAGLLFGLFWGFVASLAGVMAASIGGFVVARYLARGWVLKRVACQPEVRGRPQGAQDRELEADPAHPAEPRAARGRRQLLLRRDPDPVQPVRPGLARREHPALLRAGVPRVGRATGVRPTRVVDLGLRPLRTGLVATIALTVWVSRFTKRKLAEYEQKAARPAA